MTRLRDGPAASRPHDHPARSRSRWSAEPPEADVAEGEAIVVTATRRESSPFESPASAVVLRERVFLGERQARSVPEALAAEPGIMLQKTAVGQSSPYMRGFTGFRTLLLVDGVRFNNSVLREGPNQYWGLIDALTVERIELVGGPSSVLYGSDAIGGTVNTILRSSAPPGDEPWAVRFYGRAATAEQSYAGRAEVRGAFGDVSVSAGITGREFGDQWGGADLGELPNTGYDETFGDLRVEAAATPELDLVFGWQSARQNDVPRTHSTMFGKSWEGTTVGSDRQRDHDQARDFLYGRGIYTPGGSWLDRAELTLSWQRMDEEQDRIRSSGRRDIAGFEVHALGISAQGQSDTSIGVITAGVEWYHDTVTSYRRRIETDGTRREYVQGPVGDDSTYDLVGVYAQDEIPAADWLDILLGVRFNYAAASSDRVQDPVTGEEISLSDDWTRFVGNVRFVARPHPLWRIFGGVSQGFRAPNLSDLTRFDSARSGEVEVPSPDLEPEDYLTFELGFRTRQDLWSLSLTAHRTQMVDLITRYPTGEEIDGERVVRKANVGDGWSHGVEARADVRLGQGFTTYGGFALLDGEADVYPTAEQQKTREPLSRLAPPQGFLGIRWDYVDGKASYWVDAEGRFAGKAGRLSTRDEDDTQRIPPGGTPGYAVLHLRGGITFEPGMSVTLGIENVFDTDYRIHGSGTNMPGRNAILSVDLTF
jgi:hemoglobin/transferrin/lactoferrin receptor protein